MSDTCAVCGLTNIKTHLDIRRDVFLFDCQRCGRYGSTIELLGSFDSPKLELTPAEAGLLSGVLRRRPSHGMALILKRSERTIESLLAIAPRSVAERSLALLSFLVDVSTYFGEPLTLRLTEHSSLAYSLRPEEFKSFLELLDEQRLIVCPVGTTPPTAAVTATVTAKGYEEVARRQRLNLESSTCFVAMRFADDALPTWREGIAPAIHRAGFDPKRVDQEHFLDDVMDKVLTMIRQSRFVVAEFTEQRNGVYYEAGFAKGIGLPVVMACHKSQIERAHFDTNHLNHVAWDTNSDLQEKLYNRVVATIGQGPLDPGRPQTWA